MSRIAHSGRPSVSRPASGAPLQSKPDIDADFCEWLDAQAVALRRHRPDFLDWENVAEELESMSKRDRRELRSHAKVLLIHLLKWHYQSDGIARHGRSWKQSIRLAREGIEDIISDSPSLKRTLAETVRNAYRRARVDAAEETGLAIDKFLKECPWRVEQLASYDFLPES